MEIKLNSLLQFIQRTPEFTPTRKKRIHSLALSRTRRNDVMTNYCNYETCTKWKTTTKPNGIQKLCTKKKEKKREKDKVRWESTETTKSYSGYTTHIHSYKFRSLLSSMWDVPQDENNSNTNNKTTPKWKWQQIYSNFAGNEIVYVKVKVLLCQVNFRKFLHLFVILLAFLLYTGGTL